MLFIGVIGTPILVRIRDLQHVFIKQFVLYGGMHASLRVCFTSMYFSKYARVYGTSHSKISVKRLCERPFLFLWYMYLSNAPMHAYLSDTRGQSTYVCMYACFLSLS